MYQNVTPKKSVTHERATFYKRNQKEGATTVRSTLEVSPERDYCEKYIRSLSELSDHEEFAEMEAAILDRLVLGI